MIILLAYSNNMKTWRPSNLKSNVIGTPPPGWGHNQLDIGVFDTSTLSDRIAQLSHFNMYALPI